MISSYEIQKKSYRRYKSQLNKVKSEEWSLTKQKKKEIKSKNKKLTQNTGINKSINE